MDLPTLESIALSFPGVEKEIKWKSDLVFMVGHKMFFVIDLEGPPHSASFKVADEDFEELAATAHFRPAPYFARHHWVMIDNVSKARIAEWKQYIETSYGLVYEKLPPKKKGEIQDH